MTEPVVRGLLALVVIGLPALTVWLRNRSQRPRVGQVPSELGPFPAVLLFSSSSCPTCPPARVVVDRVAGTAMRELKWPGDTVAFHKLGVGVVPTTLVVGTRGRVLDSFQGAPEERRLRRAMEKAGLGKVGREPGSGLE